MQYNYYDMHCIAWLATMAKNCNYKLLSRGAILVLASSTLLYAAHEFAYVSIKLSLPDYLRVGFDCAHYAFYVLLPVTGWVGESWLGRYQAIVVGLIICTITLCFKSLS